MTEYMHSLGLSAEVLYYESFEGSDILLTGRIPGEEVIQRIKRFALCRAKN